MLHLSSVSSFQGTDANGKPTRPWLAVGEGLESIDIRQVASVDARNNTVTLTAGLTSAHSTGEFAGTEFIQYRWYPDVVLDNIFWHDHVDGIHGWGHGLVGQLIVEPYGLDLPRPGHRRAGRLRAPSSTSTRTDRSSPGLVTGSFRELALWTINDNDRADYSTLNLKAEPLATRLDKANQFSSWTYGDPVTPMPRLYPNDPLVVRSISVSPTVDTLHMQGGRTLLEPRYTHTSATGVEAPAGSIIDTVHALISEKYTLIFNGDAADMRMRPGDYLYGNGNELRTQQGAWGLVRILPGRVSDLKPLPDVSTPTEPYQLPTPTGGPATGGGLAGQPVPARRADPAVRPHRDRPVRHVPNGARTAYVRTVGRRGDQGAHEGTEPLVLHVVAGECVTVTPDERAGRTRRVRGGQGGPSGRLRRCERRVLLRPERRSRCLPAVRLLRAQRPHRQATIADLASSTTLKNGLYGAMVVAPKSEVAGPAHRFPRPGHRRAK